MTYARSGEGGKIVAQGKYAGRVLTAGTGLELLALEVVDPEHRGERRGAGVKRERAGGGDPEREQLVRGRVAEVAQAVDVGPARDGGVAGEYLKGRVEGPVDRIELDVCVCV